MDALWRDERLVVELDGGEAHGTASAVTRDRAKDLALRQSGHRVCRYSRPQIEKRTTEIAEDVAAALATPTHGQSVREVLHG